MGAKFLQTMRKNQRELVRYIFLGMIAVKGSAAFASCLGFPDSYPIEYRTELRILESSGEFCAELLRPRIVSTTVRYTGFGEPHGYMEFASDTGGSVLDDVVFSGVVGIDCQVVAAKSWDIESAHVQVQVESSPTQRFFFSQLHLRATSRYGTECRATAEITGDR